MANILCIETSTAVCSVALALKGKLISSLREDTPNSHSLKLTVLIESLLEQANVTAENLDAVAVSSGPGSYTGLRIGVSVSKGICYGAGIPLIALPSLEVLAANFLEKHPEIEEKALLCPMIDARRMEVYSALYNKALEEERPVAAEIIDENSFADIRSARPTYYFGDGASKCSSVIANPSAFFIDGIVPLASAMIPLAKDRYKAGKFEDVAYFEPFYLKNFVATTAKNKFF